MKNKTKELIIKTALYRSMHRGCKETDILLGVFASKKINDFDDEKLNIYSDLILEDDVFIYDWILQKIPAPKKYEDLIVDIRQFHDL
ncbi:MAG: antitoxin CptB [Myxococcota bacterium]|jgi:antitoxin CptB